MKYVCPICGKVWYTTADVAKCTTACQADIEMKEKLAKQKAEDERKKTAAAKAAEIKAREAEAAEALKELQDLKSDLKKAYNLIAENVNLYNLAVDIYNKKYAGKVPNATSTLSFELQKYEPKPEEGMAYQFLKGLVDMAGEFEQVIAPDAVKNPFNKETPLVTDNVFKPYHRSEAEDAVKDLRDAIRKQFGF